MSQPPLRLDAGLERLGDVLRRLNYNEAELLTLGGADSAARFRSQGGMLQRFEQGGALGVVAISLLMGRPVETKRFAEAMAPLTIDELERLRLVHRDGDHVVSDVFVFPSGDLILAADHPDREDGAATPNRVMGMGYGTRMVMDQLLVPPARKLLDLGTGCGVLSLVAAASCDHARGLDLDERALGFAAANARINGIGNVSFGEGNYFRPKDAVGEERFDLVVAQPAFVICPSDDVTFRDAVGSGDEALGRLLSAIVPLLEEGGFAQIVSNWAKLRGSTTASRLRAWLDGNGCDVWVTESEPEDPAAYAAGWLRMQGDNSDAERARWLAYYDELGIEALHGGIITLRKRSGGENWFRLTAQPDRIEPGAGPIVLRVFDGIDFVERGEDALRSACLRKPDDLQLAPPAERMSSELRSGLVFRVHHDEPVAQLLAKCDGETPLADVCAAQAGRLGIDQAAVLKQMLPLARIMLEHGLLLPPTPRPTEA